MSSISASIQRSQLVLFRNDRPRNYLSKACHYDLFSLLEFTPARWCFGCQLVDRFSSSKMVKNTEWTFRQSNCAILNGFRRNFGNFFCEILSTQILSGKVKEIIWLSDSNRIQAYLLWWYSQHSFLTVAGDFNARITTEYIIKSLIRNFMVLSLFHEHFSK